MSAARHLLQDYLAQLAANGVTHVKLDDTAHAKLAATGMKAEGGRRKAEGGGTAPMGGQHTSPATVKTSSTPPTTSPSALRPPPSTFAPPSEAPVKDVPSSSKAALLADLAREADNCQRARDLGTLRDVMVFATGSHDADIMFIGEAPGAEEEKQREPFVGPAGQTLTKIIQAMGLRRGDVYISNICKFRPKIDDGRSQGSKNRAPTLGEMLACQPFIMAEINIVAPKIIVCLGATAATGLGIEGTVGKLRGRVTDWRGKPLAVTYHPSYLLRQEQEDGGGLREKRLVWEDIMRVMETVGLPISDKQRGYFSKAK